MNPRWRFVGIVGVIVYATALLHFTGLIPAWGRWYTNYLPQEHLPQVEAYLHGRFALYDSPLLLELDKVWSQGGVHQVRGLGVPLWQLPFVAVARLAGAADFPDTVIFGVALGLAAWQILAALSRVIFAESREASTSSSLRLTFAGAALLFLLFPPFVGLLRVKFAAREQVIAYEYVYGLLLLSCLLSLAHTRTRARYLTLCLLAGVGGLVRASLIFYGVASVIVGGYALCTRTRSRRKPSPGRVDSRSHLAEFGLGCCVFLMGSCLLLLSNYHRFGSVFEFGYQLNMNIPSTLYATRFDYPYRTEPVLSAARELFGLLFQTQEFNGVDFYRPDFFPGQSATVRWRQVDLSTYDVSYAFLLLAGVGACMMPRNAGHDEQEPRTSGTPSSRALAALAAWGGMSCLLLGVFYLRAPVLASRYLLDFMPAFAALLVVLWLSVARLCMGAQKHAVTLLLALLLSLTAWTIWQVGSTQSIYDRLYIAGEREFRESSPRTSSAASAALPRDDDAASGTEFLRMIPFNGAGWLPGDGYVMSAATFFVQDIRFLELFMAHENPAEEEVRARLIRAKIGLELLEQEGVARTADGVRIRFRGPRNARYQSGIQPLFLAFVEKGELAVPRTAWRLLGIRWN